MNVHDLKYIFEESGYKKMNLYPNITTVNTMKQYVNKIKALGFNHHVYTGTNGQKAIELLRKDDSLIGKLENSTYPNNIIKDRTITKDKLKAEKLLRKSGVSTTYSKTYSLDQMEEARKEYFSNNNDKLAAIKPIDLSQGKGVNVRITYDGFPYYWNLTKKVMESNARKNGHVLVQEYLKGFEARAVVINGKLISIVARVPAHVIGNNVDTVERLIERKNNLRKKCGHLRKKLIVPSSNITQFLKEDGLSLDYIPKSKEYVLLTSISNTSLGGDMVDITDLVIPEIKELALDAIAAVPGLFSGGVDIMMDSFDDKKAKVLEINSWPMLQSTIYPTYGNAKDPQSYFLNSYFAIDQYLNKPELRYNIDNESECVSTFLNFHERKQKLHVNLVNKLL